MVFESGGCKYVGGSAAHLECVDLDRISLVVLNAIVKQRLGYLQVPLYYMRDPTSKKLVYVEDDEDLLEYMAATLKTKWHVDIFCDHPMNVWPDVLIDNERQIVVVPTNVADEVDVEDHPQNMGDQTQDTQDIQGIQNIPDPELQAEEQVQVDLEDQADVEEKHEEQAEVEEQPEEQADVEEKPEEQAKVEEQPEEHSEHEEVQQDVGFEFSDDDVQVDGDAVDIGLSGLRDKGKCILSDTDSDYDIDADMGVGYESSEEEDADIGETSSPNKFRDYRNLKKKLPNFTEFKDADMKNPSLKLGLVFKSAKLFKDAIREYAIRAGKDIHLKK